MPSDARLRLTPASTAKRSPREVCDFRGRDQTRCSSLGSSDGSTEARRPRGIRRNPRRWPQRRASRIRAGRGDRRLPPPRLREWAAVPDQERPERERYSDPDASWGHRSAVSTRKGGGFYGYKIHAAVCARTGLPIAHRVETARAHESSLADDLLQRVRERKFEPATAALDKGYDVNPVYE